MFWLALASVVCVSIVVGGVNRRYNIEKRGNQLVCPCGHELVFHTSATCGRVFCECTAGKEEAAAMIDGEYAARVRNVELLEREIKAIERHRALPGVQDVLRNIDRDGLR